MKTKIRKTIALCFASALLLPEFLHAQYMGGIGGGTASASLSHVNLSVTEMDVYAPVKYELFQNYPNPFNPSTNISYHLPASGYVSLKIFNIIGQEVRTLFQGLQKEGLYTMKWEGDDRTGKNAASGIYVYQLKFMIHNQILVKTRKMVLFK